MEDIERIDWWGQERIIFELTEKVKQQVEHKIEVMEWLWQNSTQQ